MLQQTIGSGSEEAKEIEIYTFNTVYVLIMKKNTSIFMINYIKKISRFS